MSEEQVNIADARLDLVNYGHSQDALQTMADEDVFKLYEKVNGSVSSKVQAATQNLQWGEKWRESLAGEDKDAMKTLTRFSDPTALWKRTQELTKKLSSGELKAVNPFPKDGTPEEQTKWRIENNIPTKLEEYDTNLPNGLVIGEEDKPFVDSYLQLAHSLNLPKDVAKGQLEWYFGHYMPEMQKALADADAEFEAQSQEQLRELWPGAEFKKNMTAVNTLLQMAPEGIRGRFWGGRTADGKPIGNDPEVIQWLSTIARELNPASSVVTPSGDNSMKGIDGRIKELEGMMKSNRAEWNKNPAYQTEYQELLDVRAKMR